MSALDDYMCSTHGDVRNVCNVNCTYVRRAPCPEGPPPAVMSPVEERAIGVFAAWLIAHIGDDAAAAGVASLVERFKAELPDDWRSRAAGGRS